MHEPHTNHICNREKNKMKIFLLKIGYNEHDEKNELELQQQSQCVRE